MKKLLIFILCVSFMIGFAKGTFAKQYTIVTVVKVDNTPWFERMREGIKKFGEDTGRQTFLLGPPKADAALQVQIIEDVIAQNVDAICVVPFSPEVVEPVLKKAMDQGIVVISHEASSLQNAHYDLEAFENAMYGAHLMKHLAQYMREEGEYAVFVGSSMSKSHNEWVDVAIALQKEKYPRMKLVTNRLEEYEDHTIAYEKTKELLKAYPNLKGIQGSAMSTVQGVGLAIEEKGLQDKVMVVGTGLVSMSKQYLESGSVKLISFWDPADLGYAMNKLAVMLLEGEKVTDGVDLGVPGYNKVIMDGKVLYGSAWIDVTKENMADYNF